jgi:hypothetical protein
VASDAPQELRGGVANAGQVVRRGDLVRRPLPANAGTLHPLLRFLRERSDVLAPLPARVEGDAELVEFVPGDVPLAPFAAWVNGEAALVDVARLLRRYHDAVEGWTPPGNAEWADAFADPAGGSVICHNDVCLENVVFRNGVAVALLDFDFAAPGRRVWDVAQTARYWVPVTDPGLPAAAQRGVTDPIARLRTFVDAYGLEAGGREAFVEVLLTAEDRAYRFVDAQARLGHPGFAAVWDTAAHERFARKVAWIEGHAEAITAALV